MVNNQHPKLQQKGWEILAEIITLTKPGISEWQATQNANEVFKKHGITQFWHPTCIKFDKNTLKPGVAHKAEKETFFKHMAIFDIGPVIDLVEVDCGKSVGLDTKSQKLAQDSQLIFNEACTYLKKNIENLSPSAFYTAIQKMCSDHDLEFIAPSAGHRLGPYPTPKRACKISASDTNNRFESGGWMIEIQVSNGEFGAFFEDYLEL